MITNDKKPLLSSLLKKNRLKTMDDKYGDGSDCIICEDCGYCIDCGDCKKYGCKKEIVGYVNSS